MKEETDPVLLSTSYNALICIGEQFLESYNNNMNHLVDSKEPLMLPPAPQQKFVDSYTAKDLKTKHKNIFDSQRLDYEAECVVYRALEKFDERITILHSFKYTCDLWKALVCDILPAKDGEHDFVVIFPGNIVVCIEVKRPQDLTNITSFKRTYKKAKDQTEKFNMFLNGVFSQSYEKPRYLRFCAFPLANREDFEKGEDLNEGKEVRILWKNDFHDLSHSLGKYLPISTDRQSKSDIEALLIGTWLQYSCDYEKDTSKAIMIPTKLIGLTMENINQRLKSQKLYCKPLHRSEDIKPVPEEYKSIFSKHLDGINYITQEQKSLLEFEKDHSFKKPYIFVNGPAGSGKTMIMYARVLKLLESMGEDEQILLLLPWWDAAEDFMEIVKKFNSSIAMKKIDLVGIIRKHKDDSNLVEIFSNAISESTEKLVIFVRPNFLLRKFVSYELLSLMHERFLTTLNNAKWHIFCDDFHSSFAHSMQQHEASDLEPLAEFLFELLSKTETLNNKDQKPKSLWIGCDLMQTVQFSFWKSDVVYKETLNRLVKLVVPNMHLSLSGNARNHHGIAILLQDLMEKFLEMSGENCHMLQQILPHQGSHHFIQGFTTKLYCVLANDSSNKRLTNIIIKELTLIHRSLQAVDLENSTTAVIPVYHHVSVLNEEMSGAQGQWCKDIEGLVKLASDMEELKDFDLKSNFTDYVKYAVSIEFPCAVLIIDLSSPTFEYFAAPSDDIKHSIMDILAHIYVGVSRARVYCSIILICSDDEPNELYRVVRDTLLPHVKKIMVP